MSRPTIVAPATHESIAQAADILRQGGLVAFPTETVYGLGANALDAAAVAKIFAAKGRPASNPVIVHVRRFDDVAGLVTDIPPLATKLADRFWPGPLTLVLPRGPRVPDIVAAGGPTVAIRAPAHPIAQSLLEACGVPLAAPSANRSTCLSPVRAEHVLRGLDGRIDMILDAGPCSGGIESTVLDVTTDPPTLLRPGLVGLKEIESVAPVSRHARQDVETRSPGQMRRHYCPAVPVEFVTDDGRARVDELVSTNARVCWLRFGPEADPEPDPKPDLASGRVVCIDMPNTPTAYSNCLYDVLHRMDCLGLDKIIVTLPPEDDDWLAIHDRLSRMKSTGEI